MNGLEIAGRQIKVGLVNESNTITSTGPVGALGELDDDGMRGEKKKREGGGGFENQQSLIILLDGGGLSLNAHSRAMLMAKLQRAAPAASAPSPTPSPGYGLSLNPAISPSPCMLLKNMFDPKAYVLSSLLCYFNCLYRETDPDFHLDIKEDVTEECSKYGKITHIYVERDSEGHVYMKFTSSDGAQKAIQALNHRWFAGMFRSCSFSPRRLQKTCLFFFFIRQNDYS